TVLIIEDDKDIRELLTYNIDANGFKAVAAADGILGKELALSLSPDLILLDLMLPGINGLELCRFFRKDRRTSNIPVIMLTAKGEETDKVLGFNYGADDYITKPFSNRELIARIHARLSRAKSPAGPGADFRRGTLEINFDTHLVSVAGKSIPLSKTEFNLLKFFVTQRKKVYSREELLDNVWGEGHFVEPRTVDVHIRRLREKIHPEGEKVIKTVRGAGYIFSECDEQPTSN
ncbi:MAG: winged helix-turn-helix domain-containing protein, partial [Nitrospinota bacterium]